MNNTANLTATAHAGLLKVSGADARKLLQGQLTYHVDNITPETGHLAAHCNPQGRIISLFYLLQFQGDYYLLMPRSMVSIAMTALKKFAVFYKVQLSDASDELGCMSFEGKTAPELAQLAIAPVKPGSERFLAIGDKQIISQLAGEICEDNHWKTLNIRDGIPAIYPETSEKFLPHDLNLPELGAISFDKGCFTGQEIIARMQYRGKLKNHLYQAVITQDTTPAAGAEIYYLNDNTPAPCGQIVDAAADNQQQRLLIITDETNAKSDHLLLDKQSQTTLNMTGLPS